MPSDKLPYDPTVEREDAFGVLAKAGYAAVPGDDHAERLARLRARTRGVSEGESSLQEGGGAVVRRLSPKPAARRLPRRQVWWTAAAAVALLIVASLVYQLGNRHDAGSLAKVVEAKPAVAGDSIEASRITAPEAYELEADPDDAIAYEQASAQTSEEPQPARSPRSQRVAASDAGVAAPSSRLPRALPVGPPSVVSAEAGTSREEVLRVVPIAAPPAPRTEPPAPSRTSAFADETLAPMARQPQLAKQLGVAPAAASSAAQPSRYTLERGAADVSLRTLNVQVAGPFGGVISDATITIEGTGQSFSTDDSGLVEMQLLPSARVGRVVAPGQDTLYFDATGREDLFVKLAAATSRLRDSKIADGRGRDLSSLGKLSAGFGAFGTYVEDLGGVAVPAGGRWELQFYVNKQGRAISISRSPAFEGSREDFQRAKAVLQGGPVWPAQYRGERWRYVVE